MILYHLLKFITSTAISTEIDTKCENQEYKIHGGATEMLTINILITLESNQKMNFPISSTNSP